MIDGGATVYRKEIKYQVSRGDLLKIAERLELLMERDIHGEAGSYMVRSQYYDSLFDRDLYDNLDGVLEKRKIRVRMYSPEDKWAKLEYKTKSGTDGIKYSIRISKEEALQMEKREFGFLLEHPEPLAKQLYAKLMQYAYMPKTIVEYERLAYTHEACDLRITVDTNVKAAVVPFGIFSDDLQYVPLMTGDVGVLEIKYNGFLPSVFKQLVRQIDSLPQANSKYTQARTYI